MYMYHYWTLWNPWARPEPMATHVPGLGLGPQWRPAHPPRALLQALRADPYRLLPIASNRQSMNMERAAEASMAHRSFLRNMNFENKQFVTRYAWQYLRLESIMSNRQSMTTECTA